MHETKSGEEALTNDEKLASDALLSNGPLMNEPPLLHAERDTICQLLSHHTYNNSALQTANHKLASIITSELNFSYIPTCQLRQQSPVVAFGVY